MTVQNDPIAILRAKLPPVFPRGDVGKHTDGLVNPRTLANESSRGTGPEGVFFVGRRACLEREAFLEWLSGRLSTKSQRNPAREAQAKREAV